METKLTPKEIRELGIVSRLLKNGETASQIIASTRLTPSKVDDYISICEEARKRKNERLELESQANTGIPTLD